MYSLSTVRLQQAVGNNKLQEAENEEQASQLGCSLTVYKHELKVVKAVILRRLTV